MPNWFENHASDPNNLSRQFSSSSWGKVSGKVLGNAQQNNREISEFLIQFLFGSCLEWTCVSQLKAWRRMLSASFLHVPFAPINDDDVSELSSSSWVGYQCYLPWCDLQEYGKDLFNHGTAAALVKLLSEWQKLRIRQAGSIYAPCIASAGICANASKLCTIQIDSFNTRMYVKQISSMSTNDICTYIQYVLYKFI